MRVEHVVAHVLERRVERLFGFRGTGKASDEREARGIAPVYVLLGPELHGGDVAAPLGLATDRQFDDVLQVARAQDNPTVRTRYVAPVAGWILRTGRDVEAVTEHAALQERGPRSDLIQRGASRTGLQRASEGEGDHQLAHHGT